MSSKSNRNVDINNPDPFYRYKMPNLIVQFRKSKTYLDNVEEVFKCLCNYDDNASKRQYIELMKWLSYSLGTGFKVNYLSGEHSDKDVQKLLNEYIDKFVLCGTCSSPETTMHSNGKYLYTTCKACGTESKIAKDAVSGNKKFYPYLLEKMK